MPVRVPGPQARGEQSSRCLVRGAYARPSGRPGLVTVPGSSGSCCIFSNSAFLALWIVRILEDKIQLTRSQACLSVSLEDCRSSFKLGNLPVSAS